MHELGVVQYIADTLEQLAKEQNLTEIASVTLEIGEVSTVIPDYLCDCWSYWRKKTDCLKDTEMKIERTPAVTMCESCGKTYSTVEFKKICPYCNSPDTHLVSGSEFTIKEIEAR